MNSIPLSFNVVDNRFPPGSQRCFKFQRLFFISFCRRHLNAKVKTYWYCLLTQVSTKIQRVLIDTQSNHNMESQGQDFLRRKFQHLFKCFEHTRNGFVTKKDAEIHSKQLENILRRQLEAQALSNDEIEERIAEFMSDWVPSAMKYFGEMSSFAQNHTDVSFEDFVAFNMSIREHIVQNDALPSWFEDSLRMSFVKCWSNNDGVLLENGLELLPGVTREKKTACHQYLTDNNNKKIDVSVFLSHIKDYYSNDDPHHISKYIHGYEED